MIKKIENVQIDITTLCNFQCRHCSVAWHKCNEEMNLDQIRDIANQLEKYDVEMIAISGGEPSLHKNFIDVVGDFCNDSSSCWYLPNDNL